MKPHRKALSINYFAVPQANSAGNEQFFYFTSLVRTWAQGMPAGGKHLRALFAELYAVSKGTMLR
jgi:hypothetical protein